MIPGIPENELEQLHWNFGGGRGALGLRHIPSGISVERECPPNVTLFQVLHELTLELQEKLGQAGFMASDKT